MGRKPKWGNFTIRELAEQTGFSQVQVRNYMLKRKTIEEAISGFEKEKP